MNHKDFFIEYYRQIPSFDRYEDAYNAAENVHIGIFGVRKFKSYAVFRATLSRFNKINRI
jgi:hypothetical protein